MRKFVQQRMVGGREEYKAIHSSKLLIPVLFSCSCGTVVGCKSLRVYLMEVDITIPSPELSPSEKSEDGLEGGLATESELCSRCQMAGEDVAVCRSSVSSEAILCTAPSAPENTDNMHSLSDVSATNLNLQQSQIDVATWSVGIDDMPDEILIKIFSHLSFCELVDVVKKVNSRWRRLSQDLELWADKEYQIKYWRSSSDSGSRKSGISDQEAIQTFCDAPNLRKVTMERGAKSRVFRALSNSCHRLSELRLHGTQKLSYSVLKTLVEKCHRIHTLMISNELLMVEKFSEAVSHLQHLRMLELDAHNSESIPVLRPLGDGCPQLAEVDFGNTIVDLDDLRYFLNAKRNTLKSIKIRWTMAGRRCVVPLLTVCADSLESLQLSCFEVVRDEAREAFTALGRLKNLRELEMMINKVAPPHTVSLAFNTGGLPKLRRLDLRDGYGLDDDTIIAISCWCPGLQALIIRDGEQLSDAAFSQIYHLKHLEILDVSNCRGLGGALIPCLTRLTRLHSLSMEEMEFSNLEPGLSSIVELSSLRCLTLNNSLLTGMPFDKFPGKLVNLRELNVIWCHDDPEAIAGLTEQMPNLEIRGLIEEGEEPFESDAEEDNGENAEEDNGDYAGPDNAEEGNGDNAEEENGVNEGLGNAEEGDGDNAGPGDTDEAQYCNCGSDGDSDSDSESDDDLDLCNISSLFPEDV